MKILITGATGLIGTSISDLCREKGWSVNYLTTDKAKIKNEGDYHGFYWNPKTNQIDVSCFDGVDAVINLAGSGIGKRWTKSYKEQILSSRLNSLRTLHGALQKLNTKEKIRIISASAIGIYPDSLSNFYTENETKTDTSFLGEVTEIWEKEIDTFQELNCSVMKIRIGLVLSSNGGALPKMAKSVRMYLGSSFGSGKQWQSWIHVDDLARMFLFAVENDLSGVYNGVAPNPVTNSKMLKELAQVLERPLFMPHLPRFVMNLVLGEMSSLLFASQRVSSKKIEKEGFNFQFKNICKTLEDLYLVQSKNDHTNGIIAKEYV